MANLTIQPIGYGLLFFLLNPQNKHLTLVVVDFHTREIFKACEQPFEVNNLLVVVFKEKKGIISIL